MVVEMDIDGVLPVIEAAAWQGVVVPPHCVAGVAANLEILRGHIEIVRAAADGSAADPAEFLAP